MKKSLLCALLISPLMMQGMNDEFSPFHFSMHLLTLPDDQVYDLLASNPKLLQLTDDAGNTVLHFAARDGAVHIISTLFKMGVNINQQTTATQSTPLAIATLSKQNAAIELLLELGADPRLTDAYGLSALHHAIIAHNKESANAILARFPQTVDQQTPLGNCPLHLAVIVQNHTIIDLLLKHKANPLLFDWSGRTPAHVAAAIQDTGSTIMYSNLVGACPEVLCYPDNTKHTPDEYLGGKIQMSSDSSNEERQEILHMTSVRKFDRKLKKAMKRINTSSADEIKKIVNETTLSFLKRIKFSPLHFAVITSGPEEIKFMLEKGFDPHVEELYDGKNFRDWMLSHADEESSTASRRQKILKTLDAFLAKENK